MSNKFIAFDVATSTGIAYESGGEWFTAIVYPHEYDKIDEIIKHARMCGINSAAIEAGYLDKNAKTAIQLAEFRGHIQSALMRLGVPWMQVFPSSWQSSYRIGGTRKDRKLGASRTAKYLAGIGKMPQDICDAICICDYANKTYKNNHNFCKG